MRLERLRDLCGWKDVSPPVRRWWLMGEHASGEAAATDLLEAMLLHQLTVEEAYEAGGRLRSRGAQPGLEALVAEAKALRAEDGWKASASPEPRVLPLGVTPTQVTLWARGQADADLEFGFRSVVRERVALRNDTGLALVGLGMTRMPAPPGTPGSAAFPCHVRAAGGEWVDLAGVHEPVEVPAPLAPAGLVGLEVVGPRATRSPLSWRVAMAGTVVAPGLDGAMCELTQIRLERGSRDIDMPAGNPGLLLRLQRGASHSLVGELACEPDRTLLDVRLLGEDLAAPLEGRVRFGGQRFRFDGLEEGVTAYLGVLLSAASRRVSMRLRCG